VADVAIDPNPPAGCEAAAARLFGDRLPIAISYAELLMTDGVVRGLIGPREAPRIWDRHLLNCAAVGELIPVGVRTIDVGSGAGLPGIVLAIARPGLKVTLVEPLARRAIFLTEAVEALGLEGTTVLRARAEECVTRELIDPVDVVTARAVAPLDRLAAWCLPLANKGGRLLALKGESAGEEAARNEAAILGLGGGAPTIRHCGVGVVEPPVTVVEITRERAVLPVGQPTHRSAKPARARRKRYPTANQ
jgi:16S rRNA (guanine527-N7)-methyltransferase